MRRRLFPCQQFTHSSNLSCNTVTHSVMYSCPPRVLLTRQPVVPLSFLEQTAFAHLAFFRTEAQSSSDWSLPFSVQHLVWARSQPNWLQHTGRSQPRQLPQSCSVSSRVVLMDIEKTCPFEAFTRPHLKGPVRSVVLLHVVCVPCNSFPSLSFLSSGHSRSPVSFLSSLCPIRQFCV